MGTCLAYIHTTRRRYVRTQIDSQAHKAKHDRIQHGCHEPSYGCVPGIHTHTTRMLYEDGGCGYTTCTAEHSFVTIENSNGGQILACSRIVHVLVPTRAFYYIPLYTCRTCSGTSRKNVRVCMRIMRHAKPAVHISQRQRHGT